MSPYYSAVGNNVLQNVMNAGVVFICLQLSLILCSSKPAGELELCSYNIILHSNRLLCNVEIWQKHMLTSQVYMHT